ncbi:hypothetical protein AMTRI_Chr11g93870 [Amborella trichopoda]
MSSVVAIELGLFFSLFSLFIQVFNTLFSIIKVGFFSYFSRFIVFHERVSIGWLEKVADLAMNQSLLMLIRHQELRFFMKG